MCLKNDQLGNIGIKIDTEGYEFNVILGAEDTLKKKNLLLQKLDIITSHIRKCINYMNLLPSCMIMVSY